MLSCSAAFSLFSHSSSSSFVHFFKLHDALFSLVRLFLRLASLPVPPHARYRLAWPSAPRPAPVLFDKSNGSSAVQSRRPPRVPRARPMLHPDTALFLTLLLFIRAPFLLLLLLLFVIFLLLFLRHYLSIYYIFGNLEYWNICMTNFAILFLISKVITVIIQAFQNNTVNISTRGTAHCGHSTA